MTIPSSPFQVLALLLASLLHSTSASAGPLSMAGNPPLPNATYQLGGCKASGDWQVLIGRCPSGGSYSGQGAVRRFGMVYLGPIKDGLPHGNGTLCMSPFDRYRDGEEISCHENMVACEVNFDVGKVSGNTLSCSSSAAQSNYAARTHGMPMRVVLRSDSGFAMDDGMAGPRHEMNLGHISTLVADLVDVKMTGQAEFLPIPGGFQGGPSEASGTARQVRINARALEVSRLQGMLTVRPQLAGKSPLHAAKIPKDALVVTGSFDTKLADGLGYFSRFNPSPLARNKDGSFPREALTTISYQGKTHQVVYYPTERASDRVRHIDVIYFKDEAGVEFDGSGPECPALNRRGLANLSAVSFSASNGFTGEFRLSPQCGTIKTPAGSYTGRFEDGRPVN